MKRIIAIMIPTAKETLQTGIKAVWESGFKAGVLRVELHAGVQLIRYFWCGHSARWAELPVAQQKASHRAVANLKAALLDVEGQADDA